MENSNQSFFRSPTFLWISSGLLLVLNIFLLAVWNNKRDRVEKGFTLLKQSDIINELTETQAYREAQFANYFKLQDLIGSKEKLNAALENLLQISKQADKSTYFNIQVSIPQENQYDLLTGINQYQADIIQLLENKIIPRQNSYRISYQKLKSILKIWGMDQSPKQQARLQPRLDSLFGQFYFDRISLKDSSRISWAVDWYESIADPTPIARLQQGLNKLSALQSTKGKIVVYGAPYPLNALTPAELEMVCKHVLMVENQVDELLIAVINQQHL